MHTKIFNYVFKILIINIMNVLNLKSLLAEISIVNNNEKNMNNFLLILNLSVHNN